MKSIKKLWMYTFILVIGGVLFFKMFYDLPVSTVEIVTPVSEVQIATSSLAFPVAGVIKAVDGVTLYAQTAGVVTSLPRKEGAAVSLGDVLAVQDTPIETAGVALAVAQGELADAQQSALVSTAQAGSKKAGIQSYSAAEIAALRAQNGTSRVSEATSETAAAVTANTMTLLSVLDYINNNRPQFTAKGLTQYEQAVRLVYGNQATYLGTTLVSDERANTTGTLLSLSEQAGDSPVAAENAIVSSIEVFSLINQAFQTAEEDTFKRSNNQSDTEKALYLAHKAEVVDTLVRLESARSGIQQVIDTTLEDSVNQQVAVEVSVVDRDEAQRQVALALEIAARSQSVSVAQSGVSVAQASLGVSRAAFDGVVSAVYAKQGEYVMPGTPLLAVVGTGARELEVTVPDAFAGSLSIGQAFVIDGVTAGFVDRFSTVSQGVGRLVVIALLGEHRAVGETLRGEIVMNENSGVYTVPRSYVHFSNQGAAIVYQSGERTPVEIVYDAGDVLFVTIDHVTDQSLLPAVRVVR